MYEQLTNDEKVLVNAELANDKKSLMIAIVLCLFFGAAGIHRLYLNEKNSGAVMLGMFLFGIFTTFLFIGFIPLMICGIWAFVDLFLCSSMTNKCNDEMRDSLSRRVIIQRKGVGVTE